jgi:hypothetical protein
MKKSNEQKVDERVEKVLESMRKRQRILSRKNVTFNDRIFKLLDVLSFKEKGFIIQAILEWRKDEPNIIDSTTINEGEPLLYGVWTEIKKDLEKQCDAN